MAKFDTFLPFATMTLAAPAASANASSRPSFLEAGTVSSGASPLASKTLDARLQLVHPLR